MLAFGFILVSVSLGSAFAQSGRPPGIPLHIGSAQPIVDEFGVKLEGSYDAVGDVVQVLWASNGVIYAATNNYDGTPHPDNPPMEGATTGIGSLTAPGYVDEGIFSISLVTNRPPSGAKFFVRVFNADRIADANFYADSKLLEVNSSDYDKVFLVDMGSTTNATDPRDPDGDGLNNSWEQNYGTDPDNPDSDGDTMRDGDEIRAGTDAGDEHSNLAIIEMITFDGPDVNITWSSVAGKSYQLQFAPEQLSVQGGPSYSNISAVITATGSSTGTTVTNGLLMGQGEYRIGLIE